MVNQILTGTHPGQGAVLEASYRCVSHTGKELIKETVSLEVIFLKTGEVQICKATRACLLLGHKHATQQQEE